MAALRELRPNAVHVLRKDMTFAEAFDILDENWVHTFEKNGTSIRDVLSGRTWIERYGS